MQYTITEAAKTDLPDIVEIYNSTIAARQSTADLTHCRTRTLVRRARRQAASVCIEK